MTEFASAWNQDLAAELVPLWIEQRFIAGALIDVSDLVHVIDSVLRCGASAAIPTVTVTPRPTPPA